MNYYDRVHFTTATTGTGPITAGAAVSADFRTLAGAQVPDGETVEYTITDGNAWETGFGVVGGASTTMTRTLAASSTGALLNLTGSAQVFLTPIAAQMSKLLDPVSSIQFQVRPFKNIGG